MNLKKILGIKEKKEEIKFVDEDLSVEEINCKIDRMSWDEAEKYLSKLSKEKKLELAINELKDWADFERIEDKRCIEKYGVNSIIHYDCARH